MVVGLGVALCCLRKLTTLFSTNAYIMSIVKNAAIIVMKANVTAIDMFLSLSSVVIGLLISLIIQ